MAKKKKAKVVRKTAVAKALAEAPPVLKTSIVPHGEPRDPVCITPAEDPALIDQSALPSRGLEGAAADSSRTVEALCRRLTYTAVHALEKIIRDPKARQSTQAQCAGMILDRGWGKPKATVEVVRKNVSEMTIEELEKVILESEQEERARQLEERPIPLAVEESLPD